MAIEVTPGAANANSYATVAEADSYLTFHLYASDWADLTTAKKEAALVMAGRMIDVMPGAWTGTASYATQAMSWPRVGMYNRNGFLIADNVIPTELKNAQIEYARQLAAEDRTADNSVISQGITKIKAGPVEFGFKSDFGTTDAAKAMVPDVVKALIPASWLNAEVDPSVPVLIIENL